MDKYERFKKLDVCRVCGSELSAISGFRCERCHTSHLKYSVDRWFRMRQKVLIYYGSKCECCNETEIAFLEVDHINNDGKAHRLITGRHVYEWIIKHDFPDDLRLLCANCNRCRGKFGICSHRQELPIPTGKYGKLCRRQRLICIEHYGSCCICCGTNHWAFLELDHINNNGNVHRREVKHGITPAWLIRNGFPDDIQLLCSNCNKAKGLYGTCPHASKN